MLKKNFVGILFASNMIFTSQTLSAPQNDTQEGNEGPYGGGGVVCRMVDHTVTAQLLDLWEAQTFKGLTISPRDASTEDQLHEALNNYQSINGQLRSEIIMTAQTLFEQVEIRGEGQPPQGLEIAAPTDLLSPFIPDATSGCEFEGLAAYDDTADVFFADFSIYNLLDKTHRAALFFHEAIYKFFRDHYNVDNSIAARNITACIFADEICAELSPMYGIPDKGDLYKCTPDGWLAAAQSMPTFNPDDFRDAAPEFYVYRLTNKIADTPVDGYFMWRFQQVGIVKAVSFPWAFSQSENVPARTFFDVQLSAEHLLTLDEAGLVTDSALSTKGHLDIVAPTYSSDSKDPWRRALGPRFTYHIRSPFEGKSDKTHLEIDGFPLSCSKIR